MKAAPQPALSPRARSRLLRVAGTAAVVLGTAAMIVGALGAFDPSGRAVHLAAALAGALAVFGGQWALGTSQRWKELADHREYFHRPSAVLEESRWAWSHGRRFLGGNARHRAVSRRAYRAGVAAMMAILALVAIVLSASRSRPESGSALASAPPAATSRPSASDRVVVPSTRGLTVRDAMIRLAEAGLGLLRVQPVLGRPGVVLASQPLSGSRAPSGMGVVLFVGVPPDRLPKQAG